VRRGVLDLRQDEVDGRDQRRGAAQTGGGRQIAGESDIGASMPGRKVAAQPLDDRRRVAAPGGGQRRILERELYEAVVNRVQQAHTAVVAPGIDEAEALSGGKSEALAAGIVGVFAGELHAARHEAGAGLEGLATCERRTGPSAARDSRGERGPAIGDTADRGGAGGDVLERSHRSGLAFS
jgi:hypothetical protein